MATRVRTSVEGSEGIGGIGSFDQQENDSRSIEQIQKGRTEIHGRIRDLSDDRSVEGRNDREPDDPEVQITHLLLGNDQGASLGEKCLFSEGDHLITEDERRDSCLLLIDGEVVIKKMIYHPDLGTHSVVLRTLHAPCLLGEIALMTDGIATASVIAKESCTAISINQMTLGERCSNDTTLNECLDKITSERLTQTARFVRHTEERLTRAYKKEERENVREIFSFTKMHSMDYTDTEVDVGSFSLRGRRNDGSTKSASFSVTCQKSRPSNRTTTSTKMVPRRGVPQWQILPEKWRMETMTTGITTTSPDGDEYQYNIYLNNDAGKPQFISSFTFYPAVRKVEILKTDTEASDIADYGFVSQIYREAFKDIDIIQTTIAEDQTKTFLDDKLADFARILTSDAPSLFHALSPIAAARGSFLTIPERRRDRNNNYPALSYRIDSTLSDIMTVLRHIERTCIPKNDKNFSAAHLSKEQFIALYNNEPFTMLDWAEKQYEQYLQSAEYAALIQKYPALEQPLQLQRERISALYREELMDVPESMQS